MKCEAAQDWLLQCESLQPKSWPRGVVKHLRVCTACYQFAKGVKRLERAWRNLPLPEECAAAKTNFLAKLAELERPEKTKPRRDRRPKQAPRGQPAWGMRWLAVAAAVFIGVIAVGWLLPGRTNASSADVVDRLVEWNMEMSNADAKERKRMFEEYEGTFRTDMKRAVLSPEERQLADYLLDKGRELATADTPLKEAEAVTGVADKLFSQAAAADAKGNETETERCGIRYSRFNAYAVKPMWGRMAQFKPPERKGGFDKDKGGLDKDKGGFDKDKGGFDKDKGGFDKDKGGFDKDKGGFDKAAYDKWVYDKACYDLLMAQQRQYEMLYQSQLHKQFEGWGKKGGPGFGPGFGFGPKGGKR